MSIFHRLMHKMHWYTGHVVSRINENGCVMIAFKCDTCGHISEWHVSPIADMRKKESLTS